MKKLKIFLYHLAVFIIGSIGIVIYVYFHLPSLVDKAGLGGIIIMPAIIIIYAVIWGILCAISLIIWILFAYFRNRKFKKAL